MASIDPTTSRVVIRLVYDGPAWAGKTTSLRNLAASLGSRLISGAEADGRTLEFDWVDYVGGLFQGLPIQCQIVAVPGQRVLERRRLAILKSADAVVFVADSRASQQEENLHSFALLRDTLAAASPPVATVVQVNKRDLADAMPLDQLRRDFGGGDGLAMTESIAARGDGVRETFVLAVRLALDRVRTLWSADGLPRATAAGDGARELLASIAPLGLGVPALPPLSPQPPQSPQSPAAEPNGHTAAPDEPESEAEPEREAARGGAQRGPKRPDAAVPPGLVWPPVHGRIIVHESAREELALERDARGDWLAESATWRIGSPVEALFFDIEEGRQALIDWARWHTGAGARLSPSRALVLAEAAPDAWRLWQIVRRQPNLRDHCHEICAGGGPDEPEGRHGDQDLGARLVSAADLRFRAERELVDGGWIERVELESLAVSEHGEPQHAGFVSFPPAQPKDRAPDGAPDDSADDAGRAQHTTAAKERIVRREVTPLLRQALREMPERLPAVLSSLESAARTEPGARGALAALLRDGLLRA
jgi:signal recognition particle receptor subunit beta